MDKVERNGLRRTGKETVDIDSRLVLPIHVQLLCSKP